MASATMNSLLLPSTPPPNSTKFSARQLSSSHSQTLRGGLSLPSLLFSASPSLSPFVYCGRGDRKTAKGKRFNHSFGNARPRNKKKGRGPPRIPVPSSPPKKDPFEDTEVVKIDIDESNR